MSAEIYNFPTRKSAIDAVKDKDWLVMQLVEEVVVTDREIERNRLFQKAQDIGSELIRKARSYGLDMDDNGIIKR